MRKVAVIPVKLKSDRVQNKNFKEFADGYSLLEFKIAQVLNEGCFDQVYISSNSPQGKELAEKYGLKHIEREDYFCSNDVSWSDVIHHVASSLPEDDDVAVAWCHTTSPLFWRYHDVLKKYEELLAAKSGYDGITTVTEFSEFLLTEKSRPFNYNWGIWHDYSQYMEKLYRVTGALFITTKGEMIKNRYVMSKKPFLYVTKPFEGLDVDTNFDFILAQKIYNDKELFNYAR
jgi:CMP-N,N'-diacetyllegionaminic acid synthase